MSYYRDKCYEMVKRCDIAQLEELMSVCNSLIDEKKKIPPINFHNLYLMAAYRNTSVRKLCTDVLCKNPAYLSMGKGQAKGFSLPDDDLDKVANALDLPKQWLTSQYNLSLSLYASTTLERPSDED